MLMWYCHIRDSLSSDFTNGFGNGKYGRRNSKIIYICLLSYIPTLYSVMLTLKSAEQLFHGVFLTAVAVKRHYDQGSA